MKQHQTHPRTEQGNILFSAMMILLIMNLLGLGLVQNAVKESKVATYKSINASVFHATESCVYDTVAWLKVQNRPSDLMPYTITQATLDHWLNGAETADMLSKLNGYGYTCTTTELISKSVVGGTEGTGEVVGNPSGYGETANMSPKFYYQVDASGTGPQNASKRILTLVSVTY